VTVDSLARANASFRRGGGLSLASISLLGAAVVMFIMSGGFRTFRLDDIVDRPPLAWVFAAILVALFGWLAREARRQRRTSLTEVGIERGDHDQVLRWVDIAAAEYRSGWLRLADRGGRRIMLSVMFASSTHDVTKAVQDHLPPGVRLQIY